MIAAERYALHGEVSTADFEVARRPKLTVTFLFAFMRSVHVGFFPEPVRGSNAGVAAVRRIARREIASPRGGLALLPARLRSTLDPGDVMRGSAGVSIR